MRGAMPNQQAVILLMGTVAQNVDIYKYRKTQVFRLIPHPHYRLEPDKIKRPEKNPIFLQLSLIWRREGDSNPRYSNPYDSLANCWFQPLTHLSNSADKSSAFYRSCKLLRSFFSFFFRQHG